MHVSTRSCCIWHITPYREVPAATHKHISPSEFAATTAGAGVVQSMSAQTIPHMVDAPGHVHLLGLLDGFARILCKMAGRLAIAHLWCCAASWQMSRAAVQLIESCMPQPGHMYAHQCFDNSKFFLVVLPQLLCKRSGHHLVRTDSTSSCSLKTVQRVQAGDATAKGAANSQ